MTIIAGYKVESKYGDALVIAGDSRVVSNVEKFESKNDIAQKVSILLPNVVIGIAGDYKNIDIVKSIETYINLLDKHGNRKLEMNAGELIKYICEIIELNIKKGRQYTDFLIGIIDYETKKQRLFKYETEFYSVKEFGEGLHLIGECQMEQDKFKALFDKQLCYYVDEDKSDININQSKIIDGNYYAIPLIETFDKFIENQPQNIGGIIQCYATMVNYGWTCICSSKLIRENEEDPDKIIALSDTVDGLNWKKQISYKNIIKDLKKTTTDYNEIKDKLVNKVKS